MTTIPIAAPTPKPLHLDTTTITSYEDGIDDFDGPLWYDAMSPTAVQLEAEGDHRKLRQDRQDRHQQHDCASPVERVKHEEEYANEAIAALWDSEPHAADLAEVRHKRRRSMLSQAVVFGEEKDGVVRKQREVCDLKTRGGRSASGRTDGVAVQVSRGAW